jgi:hypothetical protein
MRRPSLMVLAASLSLVCTGRGFAQTDSTPLPGETAAGSLEIKRPVDKDDPYGFAAPLVTVDRFSDSAGTLFRRSADPTLPAPNAPFSLDDKRFALPVAGPNGSTGRCYNLDIRPARPHRYYVFYDTIGNYRLGQYPVIDTIPGDPGYSDLWDIWRVVTPNTFRETNWIRDAQTVEKLIADPSAGYSAQSTGVYLNAPIVPEGTTASMKGEGRAGAAQMFYAWYNGKRAPFLYLEGRFRLDEKGNIPTGAVVSAEPAAAWPPRKPLSATAWPMGPSYTPLVTVRDSRGRPLFGGSLNCPIVGTAAP